MNITSITYSNYQSGLVTTPKPTPISGDTDHFIKNISTLNPVVNTTPVPKISRVSEPDKASSEEIPPDSNNKEAQNTFDTTTINDPAFSQAEIRLLEELKQVDTEVRRHEMAHIAAGGRYITSGATFTFKRGPDGKNYAVGGEVGIDTSPVPGDPQATLQKMRQIKSAALAPANPSSQDLKVASKATSNVSKALSDLMMEQAKKQASSNTTRAFGNIQKAAESYEKVSKLPENETSSFQVAV